MTARVIGVLGALLLALAISILGESSSVTVQAQGTGRAAVCHVDGGSRARLIGVSQSAVPAHMAHGDFAVPTFYADADGDGFGDPAQPAKACTQPEGFVSNADDCDDTQPG